MGKSITVRTVVLDHHWKQDGTAFFRLRLTLGRERKYIKTNIGIRREQMGKNGQIKDPHIRRLAEDAVRKVEGIVSTIDSFSLENMDLGAVVRYVERSVGGGFRLDFVKFAGEVVSGKCRSSRAAYMSAVAALREFCGGRSPDISEITSSFMGSFERWLTARHGPGARAVSSYTAAVRYIHGQARLRYNDEENGFVPVKDTFRYYRPPVQRQAGHRAVDPSVINRMLELRGGLSGRERTGVDVFLISFAMMGMNSPDMYNAAPPEDGVVKYNRQKTAGRRSDRAEMRVRLERCAMPLFREYAGEGRLFRFSEMYSSYTVLGENVNGGLAKFARRIGYAGKLTLYSARHTWATAAYRAGVDKGVINDCLCHVDREMKVTDLYIEKDWSVLWRANGKVLAQFPWKFLDVSG